MIVFRTASPTLLDLMANHPTVRPTLQSGTYRLESAELLADPRNVCLACEGGAALFLWVAQGVYNGHILLLEGHRGALGLAFGRKALGALKAIVGACIIRAATPRVLPAVGQYATRLGFVSKGVSLDGQEKLFELEL
jgi:hypothetical protein